MIHDPNFSTHHFAAAASESELRELDQPMADVVAATPVAGDPTEQYLLNLIRFVQSISDKPNPTAIERILLDAATMTFHRLAEACEPPSASRPRALAERSAPMAAKLEPLPGGFLDQSPTEETKAAAARSVSPKPAKPKKAKKRRAKRKSTSRRKKSN